MRGRGRRGRVGRGRLSFVWGGRGLAVHGQSGEGRTGAGSRGVGYSMGHGVGKVDSTASRQ